MNIVLVMFVLKIILCPWVIFSFSFWCIIQTFGLKQKYFLKSLNTKLDHSRNRIKNATIYGIKQLAVAFLNDLRRVVYFDQRTSALQVVHWLDLDLKRFILHKSHSHLSENWRDSGPLKEYFNRKHKKTYFVN